MENTQFSRFNGILPKTIGTTSLEDILLEIESDQHQEAIAAIRNEPDETKQSQLKRKLPAATFSAFFPRYRALKHTQNYQGPIEYHGTGYLIVDFDHISPSGIVAAQELKKKLFDKYNFIRAAFISPRLGVKLICKVPRVDTPEQFNTLFDTILAVFSGSDPSNKGLERCTLLSWDPGILTRPETETATFDPASAVAVAAVAKVEASTTKVAKGKRQQLRSDNEILIRQTIIKSVDNVDPNSRHNSLMKRWTWLGACVGGCLCTKEWAVNLAFLLLETDPKFDQLDLRKKNAIEAIEYGMKQPIYELEKTKIARVQHFLEMEYPKGTILLNEMSKQIELQDGKTIDSLYVQLMLQNNLIPMTDLELLIREKHAVPYHPIKHYFNKLLEKRKYEDVAGSIRKLTSCVKARKQELFHSMFLKHLIRCVEQGYGGRVNRYVFILQSVEQRTGKSEFIKYLVPEFLKALYSVGFDKDEILTLSQNFIINLEELESFNRKDLTEMKAIVSIDQDNLRKLYTQKMESFQRVGSLFASTNQVGFLEDIENSRWLPFTIDEIDFNYNNWYTGVKIKIDDVWAEVAWLWKMKEDSEPTTEEWKELRGLHEVHAYLNDHDLFCRDFVRKGGRFQTATQVCRQISVNMNTPTKLNPSHIGRSLVKMGIFQVRRGDQKGYMVDYKHPDDYKCVF